MIQQDRTLVKNALLDAVSLRSGEVIQLRLDVYKKIRDKTYHVEIWKLEMSRVSVLENYKWIRRAVELWVKDCFLSEVVSGVFDKSQREAEKKALLLINFQLYPQ